MDEVTCVDESVYSEALTRGRRYPILATDESKRQIRVRGDDGRACWFPDHCFDLVGADVPTVVDIRLSEPIEEPLTYAVEAIVELSDGRLRRCVFATPEILSQLKQADLGLQELLWCGPVVVVSEVSHEVIERALRYIDAHNELLISTRPLE